MDGGKSASSGLMPWNSGRYTSSDSMVMFFDSARSMILYRRVFGSIAPVGFCGLLQDDSACYYVNKRRIITSG